MCCVTDGDCCLADGDCCVTEGDCCVPDGDCCVTDGDCCVTDGDCCVADGAVLFSAAPEGTRETSEKALHNRMWSASNVSSWSQKYRMWISQQQ